MSDTPDDLISPRTACKLLSIDGKALNLSTFHRWLYQGKIAGYRREGRLCISRADVKALIQPVVVELSPLARDRAAKVKRDRETDATLRAAGVRR